MAAVTGFESESLPPSKSHCALSCYTCCCRSSENHYMLRCPHADTTLLYGLPERHVAFTDFLILAWPYQSNDLIQHTAVCCASALNEQCVPECSLVMM